MSAALTLEANRVQAVSADQTKAWWERPWPLPMTKMDGTSCWTNSSTWTHSLRRSSSAWKRRHAEVGTCITRLVQRGYQLCLVHPGQTHQFHERQGLRAKTDRLDAMTMARVLRET